jgi:cytochrome o ubiquinol oxidase subunit II
MAANTQNVSCIAGAPKHEQSSYGPRQSRAWVFALMVACVLLASCREGVLDPRGPVGLSERIILFDATAIMLAVVIPVIVLTLVFAWWFRADNHLAQYTPDWEYSGRIELIIWAIPALLVAFLGGMAWITSHDLDPPKPLVSKEAPVQIEVVSLDWRWLFIYPDQGIATVNQLMIPTGVPIHFRLTSTSVMNSFFIPQLGSQIYTMPGMTTQLNLEADQAGTYKGISAQFSGDGFSDMHFAVVATNPQQFQQWLDETRAKGGALDQVAFAGLAKPTHAVGPLSFGLVDPEIFNIVATGKIATRWSPEEAR